MDVASGWTLCCEICEVKLGFRSFILVEAPASGLSGSYRLWPIESFRGPRKRHSGWGEGFTVRAISQAVHFAFRRETSPLL
jgi:hypothetical protein